MAKVVILSGAGISAESGISTFRESDGLWENHDVKVVCNYDSMDRHEDTTINFYDTLRVGLEDKEPNYAHKVISELKKQYPDEIAVITQNIDNLFEKSGLSKDEVIHLHGFMTELKCSDSYCYTVVDIGYTKQNDYNEGICPTCGVKLRPNIVFFGEQAPMYMHLNSEFEDCEMVVVIGTSGNVIGVNSMASFANYSILNNLEPSTAIDDSLFSKVIYDRATEAIDIIADEIESFLN